MDILTDQIIEVIKKKSELNAKDAFDYEKLIQDTMNLIPSSYEEREEEILFQYNCNNLVCSSSIKKEDKLNQFQFLVNFVRLHDLYLEYKISFSTDNIYYDENYMPYIKERDLYGEGKKADEAEFLFLYKTYIGSILGKEYTVSQLQESGLEIAEQEVILKPFFKAQTKEEVVKLLREERKRYYENQKNNTIRVSKKGNRLKNILLVTVPLLLIIAISMLVYYAIFLNPYQKSVIAANEAYVQKRYVDCIDSLKEIETDDMNMNTKYILAFSYAKSESLEKEEIDMLTSRLSVNSNEKELDYWICLGRMNMGMAESLAQSLSDDKLLIYAYLKELNQLQNNTSIEGEEKQQRIAQLEEAIRSLGDKYTPEDENENFNSTEPLDTTEVENVQDATVEAVTTEMQTTQTETLPLGTESAEPDMQQTENTEENQK